MKRMREGELQLTEAELDAIRESFRKAEDAREFDKSPLLYEHFFRRAPSRRTMFRDDLTGQGMKFMGMLRTIVDAVEDPKSLKAALTPLAEGHAALNVDPADYALMTDALIDTFRDVLGDQFTPQMERGWRAAFEQVNAIMTEVGGAK